jgi:hypothetical protein
MKASFVILAVGLVVAGCKANDKPMGVVSAPTVWQRVRVLSPDTLVIDGRHFRLANAYAPQPVPDARCLAEVLAERGTRQIVRDLVHEATSLEVRPTGEKDGWNRALAHITLDGYDLGDKLKGEGLAGESKFDWCGSVSSKATGAPDVLKAMGPP